MSALAWAVVLGSGLAMVWAWWCARLITLDQRVTLAATPNRPRPGDTASLTPWGALERLLAPVMDSGMRAVARIGSPTAELSRRLERAGGRLTVDQFRAQQVVWASCALGITAIVAAILGLGRGASPMSLLIVVVAATFAAPLGREWMLSRTITAREQRIMSELPTVAELLALAVGAGESALHAIERLATLTRGELATELQHTLALTRTGLSLAQALEELGRRSGVPALRRFADAVATAVERGTPLAAVLRAQAQDVRADGKRALMEQGGKKEIAMMIPVVFLILPVTVIFAVFPGMIALEWGI